MSEWLPPESNKCFSCGRPGHIQADCPGGQAQKSPAKPDWCGNCDQRTRLVDFGNHMQRCWKCHPLRNQLLPQHARCACGKLRYAWDLSACDHPHHAELRIA